MGDIIIGKNTLESLSTGMYADPRAIYREYIQNATDSIDHAVSAGLMELDDAEIQITIDARANSIRIWDNGTGVAAAEVRNTLSDVGNSMKDYTQNRGFRGIGRLGGLAYCDTLYFITSAKGEAQKSVMRWDCIRMRELLAPSNKEISDIVGVISEITKISLEAEEEAAHYFEVRMENISPVSDILLRENEIKTYVALVAPVDFDGQKFRQSPKIKEFFSLKNQALPCYNIYFGNRHMPVYKLYSQRLTASVGRKRERENDYIQDVDLVYEEDERGKPLYIGWLAITDFSGQVEDVSLQGIRLRKNNILVGDERTFVKYFPSEGHTANKWFAGEIHVLDVDIIPNSQRDDFEPSAAYKRMRLSLEKWAGEINRKYRRGTSEATSAIRKIEEVDRSRKELEEKIENGAISSDTKRDELTQELEKLQRTRKKEEANLRRALDRGAMPEQGRRERAQKLLSGSEKAEKAAAKISTKIAKADYATKKDLPSSYSREERTLYQRIISVIDAYFAREKNVAEELRKAIIEELRVKKK